MSRILLLLLPLLAACVREGGPCESAEGTIDVECVGNDVLECVDGTWEKDDACYCDVLGEMYCRSVTEG